jgi:Phosphate-selective porin O and P
MRLTPRAFSTVLFAILLAAPLSAQRPASSTSDSTRASAVPGPRPAARAWYESLSLRGYAQIRYNRLFESNPDLVCAQCDRSIGNNGGFFLRRGRLILSGNVGPKVSIYIQPDYGTDAAGGLHYLQLRDAYFDLYIDDARAHRIRLGQSKVPFGFENLQSSSNRMPLDRHDALNSSLPNERDFGAFYYWSPKVAAGRFKTLIDSGLKGSGDYGVFGTGLYNGQTANRPEANNSSHAVARLTYPFRLANGQFVEASVQAYSGRFVVPTVAAGVAVDPEYRDERQAVTLVWYAQPFGLVAEYNVGTGPQYVAGTNAVEQHKLSGGFVQAMYRWRTHGQVVQPFVRLHEYHGGKKMEQDGRHYEIHELEAGVEWLVNANLELTAQLTDSDRLFEDSRAVGNRQTGRFLRLQAQINY